MENWVGGYKSCFWWSLVKKKCLRKDFSKSFWIFFLIFFQTEKKFYANSTVIKFFQTPATIKTSFNGTMMKLEQISNFYWSTLIVVKHQFILSQWKLPMIANFNLDLTFSIKFHSSLPYSFIFVSMLSSKFPFPMIYQIITNGFSWEAFSFSLSRHHFHLSFFFASIFVPSQDLIALNEIVDDEFKWCGSVESLWKILSSSSR